MSELPKDKAAQCKQVFDLFDIDKDGCISQDEVQIFTDYIKGKISDKSILTKSLPKSSVKCSAIKRRKNKFRTVY